MIKKTITNLKKWARALKTEVYALYVAVRDPRTPLFARYFAYFVIAYALSPIDLIPDFIPVLGLLDELILLPLAISLLVRLIPPQVMATARRQAEKIMQSGLPASRTAAMVIITIWALVATLCISWSVNRLVNPAVKKQQPVPYSSPRQLPATPASKSPGEFPGGRAEKNDRSRDR